MDPISMCWLHVAVIYFTELWRRYWLLSVNPLVTLCNISQVSNSCISTRYWANYIAHLPFHFYLSSHPHIKVHRKQEYEFQQRGERQITGTGTKCDPPPPIVTVVVGRFCYTCIKWRSGGFNSPKFYIDLSQTCLLKHSDIHNKIDTIYFTRIHFALYCVFYVHVTVHHNNFF
jgi:hypothetical protein